MAFDSDKIWRCTCGSAHYLSVLSVEDEGYLHIDGNFCAQGLWCRLIGAWKILRRGHYDTWVEVLLTPEVAKEIADELLIFTKAEE